MATAVVSVRALGMLLQGMHEEERAQHVRFVDVGGWLTPVGEAEPLPWQLPYHSTALLADFDPRRGGDACPDPATDRQLLGCLHTYASYHLKALQAADGRYHTPRAFDVVSVTDDAPAGTPASVSVAVPLPLPIGPARGYARVLQLESQQL